MNSIEHTIEADWNEKSSQISQNMHVQAFSTFILL